MTTVEMARLRRRVFDALELAIAAGAPFSIIEPLGTAVGMLEALAEIPKHELTVAVLPRAEAALRAWSSWEEHHLPKPTA